VPNNAVPNNAVPNNAVPNNAVPNNAVPNNAATHIAECRAGFGDDRTDCVEPARESVTRLVVPATAAPGSMPVQWEYRYESGKETVRGTTPFEVLGRPPPPVFKVEPVPANAEPGQQVAVRFTSETGGVTLRECAATVAGRTVSCDADFVATVAVPLGQPDGAMPIDWTVRYDSTRPGEAGDVGSGQVTVQVEIATPDFEVGMTPSEAAPDHWISVEMRSLTEGVRIVGCMAAFPSGPAGVCQSSEGRWLAEVRIPADARPGLHNLRWGVFARTAGGGPVAKNGTVVFPVSPPEVEATEETTATPLFETTQPTPLIENTTPTPGPGRTTTVADPPVLVELGPEPEFVAAAEPPSATPGDEVTVVVSPVEPGVEVTDCLVTFPGQAGAACARSNGRWSATVTVPATAEPGRVPLRWGLTSKAADGTPDTGNGTIDYLVRQRGSPRPPEFAIRPQPAAARAGEHVTVSHVSLLDDVALTGCAVGFTEDRLAACHPAAEGWAADLAVPEGMTPGPGTLVWRAAYQRAGQVGTADGRLTFTVLDAPADGDRSSWRKFLAIAGRVLLFGALIGALMAVRGVRTRVADRVRKWWDGDADADAAVEVVALTRPDRRRVSLRDTDPWALSLIRIRPRLDPQLREDRP
jgi:hypothetical protein